MGFTFKKLLQRQGERALHLTGDLARPLIYRNIKEGAYDPHSGTSERETTVLSLKGLISGFEIRDIDNINIQRQDLRLVLPTRYFRGVIPTTADQVVIEDKTYAVISITNDLAEVFYTFQLRQI